MFSGYYTIASGIMTRQREIDVIGNNLVNSQTSGYKAGRMVTSAFEQELLTRREAGKNYSLGSTSGATAAIVDKVITQYNSGDLKETGRNLDAAINGEGFFNVVLPSGKVCLTRSGSFVVDAEGNLSLSGIGSILGKNGTIKVGNADIKISDNGAVFDGNGNYVDTFLVTKPNNYDNLQKLNNGTFVAENGNTQIADNYSVVQGRLELSNVDLNRELTNMIRAQREFQSCSSALQINDAMNRKAVQIAGV